MTTMTSDSTAADRAPAKPRKPRRMAREPGTGTSITLQTAAPAHPRTTSKLDRIAALLLASEGASIAEIMTATGWQQHSVRGAIAGALKKRGLVITSAQIAGVRRYRAEKRA